MTENITIKPKRITIEVLGKMINNGFKEAHNDLMDVRNSLIAKIEGVDEKVDSLETRMEFRFNGTQNQLDNVYLNYTRKVDYDLLKERMKKVERRLGISNISYGPK